MRIIYPGPVDARAPKAAEVAVAAAVITQAAVISPAGMEPRHEAAPRPAASSVSTLTAELAFQRIAANVKVNLTQIENNIEHARRDSSKFFRLTMIFVSLGFFLAASGIFFIYMGIDAGYATTLCSSIPEVIAVLFFRKDQELRKTIEEYHSHMLNSQRVLTMIDLAETIDNDVDRDNIKQQIIFLTLNISVPAPKASPAEPGAA
jgi:hypothetical protein